MKNKEKLFSIALFLAFLISASSTASASTVQSASPIINETQITTSGFAANPAIYGDRIVWVDNRSGNDDIYMYNIATSKETPVTTSGSAYSPAIYGDRIVWEDWRNGNGDIYMYNLSTSNETQITTNESDQEFPAIYGDRIVWEDWRNGNGDIYMYNLSTSNETQITTNESDQKEPAIYGDKIVWEDLLNGSSDIYMCNLSSNISNATLPAFSVSENASMNVTSTDNTTGTPTTQFSPFLTPEDNANVTATLEIKQVVTEAGNGKIINIKNGETFYLELKENPSTGYSWKLDLSPGICILRNEYIQDKPPEGSKQPLLGLGGGHVWEIKAVTQGSQQVKGIYKRSWENTIGTEDNYILNVEVV